MVKKRGNSNRPEVLPFVRESTADNDMENLFMSLHEAIEGKSRDTERERINEIEKKHVVFYTNEDLQRDAFISMRLPDNKTYARGVNEFLGKFAIINERVSFQMLNGELSGLKIICQAVDQRVWEIICLLSESGTLVAVAGGIRKNRFHIKAIHTVSNQKSDHMPRNDRQLQSLLTRQLSVDSGIAVTSSGSRKTYFTQKEELRALYRCCRDSYPESIRNWAENYFENLDVTFFGSDDKRHILKSLEYVLNVDWSVRNLTIKSTEAIKEMMDERFYALNEVKERVLEIAAQIRATKTLPKWGILLCGPAGVGKSSIAGAIADMLGMPEAYIEFATLRDSETLSGSARIYSNGKPGMIMERLYAMGTANAVIVLSEIDKANAASGHGNPLDVCLPLLDGLGFADNYLELKLPTNGLFFVATCNDPSAISKPILDRFYRIDIPAYSAADKEVIYNRFVMPQTLKRLNLKRDEVTLSNQAKELFFSGYALEPGVRDVEQYVEKLTSHYLLLKEQTGIDRIRYTTEDLRRLLGPSKRLSRNLIRGPGMVTSCCFADGRPHSFILEAVSKRGSGKLEMYNIPDDRQKGYCSIAYECANHLLGGALRDRDIIVSTTAPLPENEGNYIGVAVCAAILSAVKGFTYSEDELFLGGCDLLGNMYLDTNMIDPVLKHVSGETRVIYTALGAAKLCSDFAALESVSIAEFPNMLVLFGLANQEREF